MEASRRETHPQGRTHPRTQLRRAIRRSLRRLTGARRTPLQPHPYLHPVPHSSTIPLRDALPPVRGLTRSLHRLVPQLRAGDYSGLRRRTLALNPDPYKPLRKTYKPITIAVDLTGVKVHRAGGWAERRHGKRKRYVKLHFAVEVESKEVVAMEVSTNDAHDVKALPGLVEEAEGHRRIAEALGDGVYDSGKAYEILEARGIEPVIKPRRNSRPDTPSPARRVVQDFKDLGYEAWNREKGYSRRWAADTAFSTFKRLFGEHSLARTLENINKELTTKVALYNMLINL
ncbi:MAG: IS5 family transposase [Chloroflexi bacterium]|nr:MAG: IS5 family transposase [Chloroflexota bacterium]